MNATQSLDTELAQLAEFYARLITDTGVELASASALSPGESRRARRVERQRASRLVRALSTARRPSLGTGSVVAA